MGYNGPLDQSATFNRDFNSPASYNFGSQNGFNPAMNFMPMPQYSAPDYTASAPVQSSSSQGFARGGMVDPGEQDQADQLVGAVIQAIQDGGQSPEEQQAIAMFVKTFGQKALTDLIQKVGAKQNEGSPYRSPTGQLSGPGDGQSDSIPAVIDGTAPASLSTGEHVVDKLTVDAAGGGDNQAGHDVLNKIKEGIRTKAYGSPQLPQPGNVNRILRG
jgi:hypothetical protein